MKLLNEGAARETQLWGIYLAMKTIESHTLRCLDTLMSGGVVKILHGGFKSSEVFGRKSTC